MGHNIGMKLQSRWNSLIYHLLPAAVWQNQAPDQPYRHASLQDEGFIHCTGESSLLVQVANRYFGSEPGEFVILCINEANVQAEVRWEPVGELFFPHIYGPLNLDAIVKAIPFPRTAAGEFILPEEFNHRSRE
jgi:uncharacterized protein (DUF952 family)